MRRRFAVVLALSCLPSLAAASSWEFTVTVGERAEVAEIAWTLRGLRAGPLGVCADRDGAARFVRDLRAAPRAGDATLARDPDDDACWRARVPRSGTLRLRYRVLLDEMARARRDPDFAMRAGGGVFVCDQALLLRPDPLPDGATITVAFRLPAGWNAAAPWRRDASHFTLDARQYDAGSYVALGPLHSLGAVPVAGGALDVHVFDAPRRTSDDELRRWLGRHAGATAALYGGLPGGRVLVAVAPIAGGREPGIFGSVLRHAAPSVALLVGAEADAARFERDDWVAPHELFHLGNPRVARRLPWFSEGFATYYEHVLRARTGAAPERMWGDLVDGFRRECDPSPDALASESRRLGESHNYPRVYWGGACLAFRLDVAIRRRAGGRSLDHALRDLRRLGADHPLTEEEIVATLDAAAGTPIAREQLAATRPVPLDETWRLLGVVPGAPGADTVTLREDAPLASLRRAIFAP